MKTHFLQKKITVIIAIGIISVFFAGPAHAQFGSDTLVNDDNTEFNQFIHNGIPSVAIHGNTVFATWLDSRAGATTVDMGRDVYFAKGTMDAAGKVTFGANVRVKDIDQSACSEGPSAPSIAVTSDGTICIVWKDNRDNTGLADSQGDSIYLARSVDDGISFMVSQKLDILPDTEAYLHRRSPRVAAAGGYVYVTFGKGMQDSLEMVVSSDNGQTFGSVQEILPVPADESVISADSSYLYIGYISTVSQGVGLPAKHEVILYISSDYGQTFGNPIVINDDAPADPAEEKNREHLSIAASGDNLYLAWRDDRNSTGPGGQYVYGAVSHDRGVTFGSNIILGPDQSNIVGTSDDNRWAPSISAWADNVAVSSHGKLNTYQSVIARISTDRGVTWTDEMMVSDTFNRPAIGPSSLAINNSMACVLWEADGEWVGDTGTGDNMYAAGYVFGTPGPAQCPEGVPEFSASTSELTLPSVCIDGVYIDTEIKLILDFTTMTFKIK
ncbi:MAG: sialidase family protein [Thermodesulfobacteriota bacterium]|nr:sialidase family protein [Thermodesulfobacteriota bacterium]